MQGAKDLYHPALGMPSSSSRARAGGGLRRNHGQTDRHEQTQTGSISPHHYHTGGAPVPGARRVSHLRQGALSQRPARLPGHGNCRTPIRRPTARHRPDAFGERRGTEHAQRHGVVRIVYARGVQPTVPRQFFSAPLRELRLSAFAEGARPCGAPHGMRFHCGIIRREIPRPEIGGRCQTPVANFARTRGCRPPSANAE